MPQVKRHRGWREAALAGLLLLLSFFMPWLYSMGTPVAAHEIRERLAGPHRLVSTFASGSKVSRDYDLALWLYAIPVVAGLVVLLVLLGRYRSWIGLTAGAVGLGCFLFLRSEVGDIPFHRLASGSYLAFASGAALALSPFLHMGSRFK